MLNKRGIILISDSAWLAVNPITVNHFAYLFIYSLVGRDSDSMFGPSPELFMSVSRLFGV